MSDEEMMLPATTQAESMAVAAPLSVAQLVSQVELISDAMRQVMREDEHFGKIAGAQKPSLWKPGAEKLKMLFKLSDTYVIEDLSGTDRILDRQCVRYRIKCTVTHQGTGLLISEGVGECSSLEEKYAWRNARSTDEYDETEPSMRRMKYWHDGRRRQVAQSPHDVANTVLKMAKKRAFVDAILTSTGASDLFTQDMEKQSAEEQPMRASRIPKYEPIMNKLIGADTDEMLEASKVLHSAMSGGVGAQNTLALWGAVGYTPSPDTPPTREQALAVAVLFLIQLEKTT